MATSTLSSQKFAKLFFPLLILFFVLSTNFVLQSKVNKEVHLEGKALENYRLGLNSDIKGIAKSYLYFAGKYKIAEVAPDLLTIFKNSSDEEICNLAIWSIYEIGDKECCSKLHQLLENHPIEKIKVFCKFLKSIKDYENELLLSDLK